MHSVCMYLCTIDNLISIIRKIVAFVVMHEIRLLFILIFKSRWVVTYSNIYIYIIVKK